jgi:hypothetical protein
VALRVDWAVPCRYAEASTDGTATIVGAGIDSFWPGEVPSDIGLFLMIRIVGPQDEFEEEHRLEVRLVTPESDEQQILEARFQAPPGTRNPLAVPGMETGMLVPAGIAFRAEDYGFHTLELYLDDQRVRSIPVNVRPPSELEVSDSEDTPDE